MKTMDRTHTQATSPTAPLRDHTRRAWWPMAIVAVLALGIGLAVGWLVAPSSDEAAYQAGGGTLSARQEEMVDVVGKNVEAWRSSDADALLATFTPSGVVTWGDREYRADDGTLASFVSGTNWSSLKVFEPMLVDGDRVSFFYTLDTRYLGSATFTSSGDVLMTNLSIDL